MDRDPGDFRRGPPGELERVADQRQSFAPAKPVEEMSDDEFDAWMETLPPPPGLPSTAEEIGRSEARAMQEHREGQSYPHEIVSQWLVTWGKPGRKSFFEWLADRDG